MWGWPAQVTDAKSSARTLSWGRTGCRAVTGWPACTSDGFLTLHGRSMFVLMVVASASMAVGMIVTVSIHRRISADAFFPVILCGRLFRGPS